MSTPRVPTRFFTSYSGTQLPLRLVGELAADAMRNRNTFVRGTFDDADRLIACERVVYGEVELRHDYSYHPDGKLARAAIDDGSGEANVLEFPA